MDSKEGNEQNSFCNSHSENCGAKIIETSTLNECPSVSPDKFPHYKIPVVLSDFTVQIDIESKIKLAEPAIEIKRIKKNVFLTQCRLIGKTKKLFIKGFIRKNIEYATENSSSTTAICGDIKHTTIHVPFQCITELDCLREPQLYVNPISKEITYWDEKNLGRDMKETDFYSEEFFNEKVYCELLSARIYEADITKDFEKGSSDSIEHVFQTFIEKEILYLSIKLLQNRQIWSWELCPGKPSTDPCSAREASYKEKI